MKLFLKWGIWLYIAAACAYVFYGGTLTQGFFDSPPSAIGAIRLHQVKLTLIIPLLVLLIPSAVLAKLSGVQDQLRSAGAGAGSPGLFVLLGVVAFAIAAGAGWYGYWKSTEKVEIESVDLSKGETPRSTHVAITGIARTDYIVEFETKNRRTTRLERYVPLTAASWRQGQPLVYFMKTNTTAYMPPGGGKVFMLSPKNAALPDDDGAGRSWCLMVFLGRSASATQEQHRACSTDSA